LHGLAFVAMLLVTSAAWAGAQTAPTPQPTDTPASSFMPLAAPSLQAGPPISVDDVLAQSREYDNKPVAAVGVAERVRTDATSRGSVLQFDLCGHRCIHVLDASNPSIAENSTATVTGTFHTHFSHGRFSVDDIILIFPGGAPADDSSDWLHNLDGSPETPRP
jgi:hypothetical protein